MVLGGVSGGVGSMIGGGNFIDGFRQGLITSGLNHAMEHAYKSLTEIEYNSCNARKVYREYYGEIPEYTKIVADGTYPINEETKNNINNNGWVSKAFEKNSSLRGYTHYEGDGKSTIYMFKAAFTSKKQLIMSLGHEMFHANLMNAGVFGGMRHHQAIYVWQSHVSLQIMGENNYYYKHSNSFKFVRSDMQYAPKLIK